MVFVRRRQKRKKELVSAGIRIADECQNTCVRQLCIANETTDHVCAKQSPFGIIATARIRPCRASHLHLATAVQCRVVGSYLQPFWISTFQNSWPKLAIRTLPRCLNPVLISAAPHYGLRYGSAPATGNFQRLRGRPPLVSPLKSCMRRSFTAMPQTEWIS